VSLKSRLHAESGTSWLPGERGKASKRFGRQPSAPRALLGLLAGLELVDDVLDVLVGQVLVEVVIDLHHRRVHARTQTLHLGQREQPIVGRVTRFDA
jgi:hypothetical protein